MSIYYLVIGVVVFLGIAAVYAMKMLKSSKEDLAAVPISDVQEITALKKAYTAKPSVSQNSDENKTLASHFVNENIRKKQDAENLKGEMTSDELSEKVISLQRELEFLKQRSTQKTAEIDKLKAENERMAQALQKEVSSKDGKFSEEDKKELVNSEVLTQDNLRIQKELDSVKKINLDLQKEIEALKIVREFKPKDDELTKITQLEKDVARLKSENERLLSDKNTIGSREMENIRLKKSSEEMLHQLNGFQARYDQMESDYKKQVDELKRFNDMVKQEKEKLDLKIKQSEENVQALQYRLESIKKVSEEQLFLANAEITKLKEQLQRTSAVARPSEISEETEALENRVKQLEKERQDIVEQNTALEVNISKLKEYNQQLLEKERILQYELTKSRAQTLGLERVCADFKVQIDHLSRVEK